MRKRSNARNDVEEYIVLPGVCGARVMLMKHGWWKSVAVLCLVLQVGFLAAGLLHFAAGEHHDHRHIGREQTCSDDVHIHLASHKEAHAGPDRGTHGNRLSAAGNVVPCPSEHCLICSLSDLVRSSDVESADESLEIIFSVRCSADALRYHNLQGVFRPCLPRGPPVLS